VQEWRGLDATYSVGEFQLQLLGGSAAAFRGGAGGNAGEQALAGAEVVGRFRATRFGCS